MIEGSWGVLAGFDVVRLGEFEGFGLYGVGGLGRNLQNDPLYSSGSYTKRDRFCRAYTGFGASL